MSIKNILIYGTYKCGTDTLLNKFSNVDHNACKLHSPFSFNCIDYDIIFIPIRDQLEIYCSAFFQNISTYIYEGNVYTQFNMGNLIDSGMAHKAHEYTYGTKSQVIKNSIEDIIEFFLKMDWPKYDHLSIKELRNSVYEIYNVDIYDISFNKKIGYKIVDKQYQQNDKIKNVKLCILTVETLSNTNKLYNIFSELGFLDEECKILSKLNRNNIGKTKWYGEKYADFLNNIPDNYYKKYNKICTDIKHHFYE